MYKQNIYCVGTVRTNRKQMSTFSADKQIKRRVCEFQIFGIIICYKWVNKRAATLTGNSVNTGREIIKISSVTRREKGVAIKSSLP